MKFWKEKELNPVEKMDFWKGEYINKLEENEVFVFGANPQARHFAGVAKVALGFGAVLIDRRKGTPGVARGLSPNNKTYALITKSLEAGYTEPETGITYHKEGFQSVSPAQIRFNIEELYETAKRPENLNKKFLITYKYESWPNGSPKKSLNGYTAQEMLEMFAKDIEVPANIIFHESYKSHLEKLYKNRQHNKEFLIFEDNKNIDIKEENIIWIIKQDERNPEGRHGLGAAKLAKAFGAVYGKGRGLYGQTYALVTKNLNKGYYEASTGIKYDTVGYRSVSLEQISHNIDEMYECARNHPDKLFIVAYKNDSKNLNGYSCRDLWDTFTKDKDVPENMRFHESFKYFVLVDEQDRQYREKKEIQNNSNSQKQDKFTFFWLTHTPFSQWHPSVFTVKNITFSSAEQFMMYCKAKLFKDEKIAQQIMDFNNSGVLKDFIDNKVSRENILKDPDLLKEWNTCQKSIKNLGRKVSGFIQEVWDKHNENFITRGSYEKFTQDLELKPHLLKTEGTKLVEASPYDTLYGIGMKASDPRAKDPSQWLGKNLLGKALDRAKDRMINEQRLSQEEEQTPVKKLKI